jgi:hypothetical protein
LRVTLVVRRREIVGGEETEAELGRVMEAYRRESKQSKEAGASHDNDTCTLVPDATIVSISAGRRPFT